jgi:lambda family phage minor tail protein L
MPTTPEQRSRWLEPGVLIRLYELDLTQKISAFTGNPGVIWYFHEGASAGAQNLTFYDGNCTGTTAYSSATANFAQSDVGLTITGFLIPHGTTILSVANATTITLSLSTTGTGTNLSFTIAGRVTQGISVINYRGNQYNPYPIKAEGFEWNTQGTQPRPRISVSNIASGISALLREFDNFVGGTLTQRLTYSIYLDDGIEHGPPYKEFTPMIFVIDRKTVETNTMCSFDLATGMDAEGVLTPRRPIMATSCPWIYRATECGYTGNPVQNRLGNTFTLGASRGAWVGTAGTSYAVNDYVYVVVNNIRIYAVCKAAHTITTNNVITVYNENYWMLDVCLKKLGDCQLHFGTTNPLPYGGFPGANKLQ